MCLFPIFWNKNNKKRNRRNVRWICISAYSFSDFFTFDFCVCWLLNKSIFLIEFVMITDIGYRRIQTLMVFALKPLWPYFLHNVFMFDVRSSVCVLPDFTVPLKLHSDFYKAQKTMVESSIEQGLQFHWRCSIAFIANANAFEMNVFTSWCEPCNFHSKLFEWNRRCRTSDCHKNNNYKLQLPLNDIQHRE